VSESLLAERFEQVCRDRASVIAVRDLSEGTATTFADLSADFQAFQRAFRAAGLGRGSLVVSLVGNRAIYFPLVAACLEVGATLLPLGETTTAEAVALVERSGAAAMVSDRPLPVDARSDTALPGGMRLLRLDRPGPSLAPAGAAMLKLTSGSTELPRVAVATEAHLVNDGRHMIEAMAIGVDEVNLVSVPLSHSYALGNVVVPLLWQGTAVAVRQSFNPAAFAADVAASGATMFPGVPFMFERLAALPLEAAPRGLRLLVTAGAPIGLATLQWFSHRLGLKIHSLYGTSETGGIAFDDSDDVEQVVHVGRSMPETTLTIRDSVGGLPGRIFVQGSAVCAGYAGQDAPNTAFVDGGFLSTDLGYLDPAGRLVLAGRVSPLVNVAGRKVDPGEVERALRGLEDVADARVLGTACARRGEQLAAVVVRRDPGLKPAAIRRRLAAQLSAYKIPRLFVFLDALPVDARGKVDRRTLEALVAAEGEA
jgi:acyl-CoA synthetase (AMP-forming)/AMP-acid ligase II